jgi:haloacid dehalogenase superfamily, subfamily IA, variant 3 with third motif having DD or ED/haloacid dehalogenase superfamily, subfamily IA, variant 1 with third motif having Dx(3-4)D or Dx(3-4)E
MSIRAVFFDLGGVIVRTEYETPRERLAERLGMEYDDLNKIVFDSETGQQASIGAISSLQHWEAVMKRLKRPYEEMTAIRDEFFAGDIVDRQLLDFLRSLRGKCITGLISNAWSDLRDYIVREKMDDAFDHIIISAEVGVAKPEAKIFQIALKQAGVSPSEAVFVDDFTVNIEGCEKVGIRGIHFKDASSALQQLKLLLSAGQLR